MHWAITNLHRRSRLRAATELEKRRKRRLAPGCNRFHQFHRAFIRGSTDISCADVVIISEDARQVAVDLNSSGPIFLATRSSLILLGGQVRIGPGWRRRLLAQI